MIRKIWAINKKKKLINEKLINEKNKQVTEHKRGETILVVKWSQLFATYVPVGFTNLMILWHWEVFISRFKGFVRHCSFLNVIQGLVTCLKLVRLQNWYGCLSKALAQDQFHIVSPSHPLKTFNGMNFIAGWKGQRDWK